MSTSKTPTPESLPDQSAVDLTAADVDIAAEAPQLLATSFRDYLDAQWRRIKNGESGSLMVIVGLIAIVIFFQIENSHFLTSGNLVNLMVQASIFVVFGVAQTFPLILSEIDLSLGYGAGVGAFVIAELIAPPVNWPWWLGIIGGLVAMAIIGFVQGGLIAWLGLPSFIVTLGGQLALLGLMIEVASADSTAVGGSIQIDPNSPVTKLVNSQMSPTLGWIVLIVCIVLGVLAILLRQRSRKSSGLATPPLPVAMLPVVAAAVAGVVLLLIANANRGTLTVLHGMPWVVPFVLVIVFVCSWFMSSTRTGRYIYAVGNSHEAARRAGINVKRILVIGFVLSSVVAGLAGLIYESNQGSMSIDINGGQQVMFAVAAAVIGGTSLYGGRGKIMNALLGGLVIGVVANGLGLMGVSAAIQDIVTAGVLIVAVSLDAVVGMRVVGH